MKKVLKLDGSNNFCGTKVLAPDPNPYDPVTQPSEYANWTPTYTIPADHYELPELNSTLIVNQWSGILPWDNVQDSSYWIEGGDQAAIDQAFVDYCEEKKIEIDRMCALKFKGHFFNPDHDQDIRDYLTVVHTLKAEVANAYWNANDKPSGDASRHPEAKKEDSQDSTSEYYFLLTRESATRQISMTQMVAAVKNLTNIQIDAYDDLEEVRTPKKDEIDIERDKVDGGGNKVNDYAAVDTIVQAVSDTLDAMSWQSV